MGCTEIVKIGDVSIKDIASHDSQSSSRPIINANFKSLKKTLESVWCSLDDILSYDGGLGSIDLHSDVTTSGINSPTIGQILGWNGLKWVPLSVSGGGGAPLFLSSLNDVDTLVYPLADGELLRYDLSLNKWKNFLPTFGFPSDVQFTTPSTSSAIPYKHLLPANAYQWRDLEVVANGQVLWTASGMPSWKFLRIDDLEDVEDQVTPEEQEEHVLWREDSTKYVVQGIKKGIKKVVELTKTLHIEEFRQYIVFEEFILDGTLILDGELIVL